MISARIVELIQNHAPQLTTDTVADLLTNEHTPSFRRAAPLDLEGRIFRIYNHLGDWIAAGQGFAEAEFEEWGRKRFGQGIALSEIVYAILVMKQHLSRYVSEHGLIEAAFPRTEQDYVLPMHLHSLQELNGMVNHFFDRALYHLAKGYEMAAARRPAAVR
jgi:hypothetical protein